MKQITSILNEEYPHQDNQNGVGYGKLQVLEFNRLLVATDKGYEFVEINKLVCLIADGNYTHLYDINEHDLLVSKAIGEFEPLLTPKGFYRIHHGHIINFRYMKSYNKKESQVLMMNGKTLLVSERKKSNFLKYCRELCIVS